MKTCSVCRELKDKTFFGKDKTRKDGLSYVCKPCALEKSRIYQKMNPTNLQLLCPDCNRRKGAKDPIDFMQERGFLL